jgi:tetratricopeptide (TPR) repeat protein
VEILGRFHWRTLDEGFSRIRGEIERASRCEDCSDTLKEPIRAAVMLHLDRDLFENPPHQDVEQKPPCGGRHAERALEYASLLARRDRTRDFARRFFLAMTWRAEWDACMQQARAWARIGLNAFPEDPDLRLALGVSYEKAARLGTGDPERSLREARRELSRVVSSAPERQQARVHLGRVLWRLGFTEAAQRTLEAVLAAGSDDRSRYLAHVFLGQVHERKGRTELATQAFRRALEVVPDGQAAALGLAHALLVHGDTIGAASATERALSRKASSLDPYRDYNADNAGSSHDLFDTLRRESLQ